MAAGRTKKSQKKTRNRPHLLLPIVIVLAIVVISAFYLGVLQDRGSNVLKNPESTIGDFKLVSDSPITIDGKIVVLFIGAEACPFCASESWSIVSSLNQFGTWSGVSPIISNSTDSIPNVPGYSFANASLMSSQVAFEEVETTTTSWSQKLQSLNSTENSIFSKYDPQGSMPFLLIGGMYLHIGAAVSPTPISDMNWNQSYNLSKSQGEFHSQIVNEEGNITDVINYLRNPPPMPTDFKIAIDESVPVMFANQSTARTR